MVKKTIELKSRKSCRESCGRLEEALEEYAGSDMYSFHMPGHKGQGPDIFRKDITEIDGFDNLHNPEGILLDEMKRAAAFYGTKETFFLVNGSTVGILTAISAAVPFGGTILIERGCHISVYHAACLRHLKVRFIEELQEDRPVPGKEPGVLSGGADAVVITSPSYEGLVKDVRHWAEYARRFGMTLIVDEAHGAHFSMHPYFPESAVRQGADLVIQSTHKTLPAMTQTALLHNVTGRVDGRRLQRFLDIYETSSPSYILMSSVTAALHAVMDRGPSYFDDYAERLRNLRAELGKLQHLKLLDVPGQDPGKIVIRTDGTSVRASGIRMTGPMLYDILRQTYHLQPEMKAPDYVLLMTSVSDTEEGFSRLLQALTEIDGGLLGSAAVPDEGLSLFLPPRRLEIFEAYEGPSKRVSLEEAVGRVSADFVIVYPPDAPVLVPGEIITEETEAGIRTLMEHGLTVTGVNDGVMTVSLDV